MSCTVITRVHRDFLVIVVQAIFSFGFVLNLVDVFYLIDFAIIFTNQKEILTKVGHFYEGLFKRRDHQISDEVLANLQYLPSLTR